MWGERGRTMNIFRIHIRPTGGLNNKEFSFEYCVKNNLLGVGWQISKEPNEMIDWDTYEKKAVEEHEGDISVVRYIKQWVSKGDLVWTRDTEGQYYIAKILSPWEYFENQEAKDADIVNIFRVKMIKIGSTDEVPGKIIACFRAQRTIQAIYDKAAVIYTKLLWNQLNGKSEYEIEEKIESVWSLLSAEQVEDLVFLYLQVNNWYVIPHSRKKDTMAYEFYLINKVSFERAIVQVKTGKSRINLDGFHGYKEQIFFFQPSNYFDGTGQKNHNIIKPEEIESFVKNNQKIIPSNILNWWRFLGQWG